MCCFFGCFGKKRSLAAKMVAGSVGMAHHNPVMDYSIDNIITETGDNAWLNIGEKEFAAGGVQQSTTWRLAQDIIGELRQRYPFGSDALVRCWNCQGLSAQDPMVRSRWIRAFCGRTPVIKSRLRTIGVLPPSFDQLMLQIKELISVRARAISVDFNGLGSTQSALQESRAQAMKEGLLLMQEASLHYVLLNDDQDEDCGLVVLDLLTFDYMTLETFGQIGSRRVGYLSPLCHAPSLESKQGPVC